MISFKASRMRLPMLVLFSSCLFALLLQIASASNGPPSLYKCVDWDCEEWISKGKTLLLYMGRTDKHLSFKKNQDIIILGKPVDESSPDWIGKIGNKIGLVPRDYIREDKMNKKKGPQKFTVGLHEISAWSRNDEEKVEQAADEVDDEVEEEDENEVGVEDIGDDEDTLLVPPETPGVEAHTESAVPESQHSVDATSSIHSNADSLQTSVMEPDSSNDEQQPVSQVVAENGQEPALSTQDEISSDPVLDSISLQPSTDTVLQGTTTIEYLAETPKTDEQKPTDDITPRIPETVVLDTISSIQNTLSGLFGDGITTQLDSLEATKVETSSVSEEETQFAVQAEEQTANAAESIVMSEVRMESEVNFETANVVPRKVESVEPEKLPETLRMESATSSPESVDEIFNVALDGDSVVPTSEKPAEIEEKLEEPQDNVQTIDAQTQTFSPSEEESTPTPQPPIIPVEETQSNNVPQEEVEDHSHSHDENLQTPVIEPDSSNDEQQPVSDVGSENGEEPALSTQDEISSDPVLDQSISRQPSNDTVLQGTTTETPKTDEQKPTDDISPRIPETVVLDPISSIQNTLSGLFGDGITAQLDSLEATKVETSSVSEEETQFAVQGEEQTANAAESIVMPEVRRESEANFGTDNVVLKEVESVEPEKLPETLRMESSTSPQESVSEIFNVAIDGDPVVPTSDKPAEIEEELEEPQDNGPTVDAQTQTFSQSEEEPEPTPTPQPPIIPVEETQSNNVPQEEVEDHSHSHDDTQSDAHDDDHQHHHHHHHHRHNLFKDTNDTETSSLILVIKHISSTLLSFLPEPLQDTILDVDDALVLTGIIALTLVSICVPYFLIEAHMSLRPLKKKVVELNKSLWKVSAAYETQQEEFEIFKQKAIAHDEFKKRAEQSENDVVILKKLETKHREQITALKNQLKSQMKEAVDIRALIEKTLEAKKVVAEECEKYKAAYESTKVTLHSAKDELNSIQTQAKSSALLLNVSGRNVEVLNSKISMLEQEAEEIKIQLVSENEKRKAVEKEKHEVEQCKAATEKELTDFKSICHQYEESVSSLNDEISKLESELTTIKETLGDDSPLLEVAEIQAKAAFSEKEAESLRTRLNGLSADNDNLSGKVKEMSSALEDAHCEREKTNNRLQVLEKYFKEREEEYIKTIEQLQLKESVRDKGKEELIKIIEEKDNVCKDLDDRLEALKEEFEETKQQHRNEIRTLEAKGHENWLSLCQAERKAQDARKEAQQLRQRLTVLSKEKDDDEDGDGLNGEVPMFPVLPDELVPLPIFDEPPSYFDLGDDFVPPPPLPEGGEIEPHRPPPLGGRLSPSFSDYNDNVLSPIGVGRRDEDCTDGSSGSNSPRRSPPLRGGWVNVPHDHEAQSRDNIRGLSRATSSPVQRGVNL